jgi:hypothetical protein
VFLIKSVLVHLKDLLGTREATLLELFHCFPQFFYLCFLLNNLSFLSFQLELLFLDS